MKILYVGCRVRYVGSYADKFNLEGIIVGQQGHYHAWDIVHGVAGDCFGWQCSMDSEPGHCYIFPTSDLEPILEGFDFASETDEAPITNETEVMA